MKQLTVLSRSYCHLCDDMIAALQELRGSSFEDFDVDVVDIDQFPSLERKWGEKVPVLLCGDVEICHYFLDQDLLSSHLDPLEKRA